MIAEMAPLHRPRNDVGPKGGNAFAAGIAHRRIDDSICPAVTALASEDLRRRIIVRCEQGFEAPLRSDIEQIGRPRPDQSALTEIHPRSVRPLAKAMRLMMRA